MKKTEAKLAVNLYLLKEDIKEAVQVFNDLPESEDLTNIKDGAIELYYINSPDKTPPWASKIKPFCKDSKFEIRGEIRGHHT